MNDGVNDRRAAKSGLLGGSKGGLWDRRQRDDVCDVCGTGVRSFL